MIPTISKSARKLLCKKCVAKFPLKKPAQFRREMRKKRLGEQEQERLTGKGARAAVRAECVLRANGYCECGCGRMFAMGLDYTEEWDEFYGRRHVSAAETWMLTRWCHRLKTENAPGRAYWDAKFKRHCEKYGYPYRERFGGRPKADAPTAPPDLTSFKSSARESR